MSTYDPFTDTMWTDPTSQPSRCASCLNRPSLESSSVGSSSTSITSISSYEDGWDDHEGPAWDDPLDAEAVAKQAGFSLKRDQSLKRTSSRCTAQSAQEEKRQRGQTTTSTPQNSPAVPCPPDIEEIDLYMPSVEPKWFNTPPTTETIENSSAVVIQNEIEIRPRIKQQSGIQTQFPARKARGCGYSCKLHDVRRSGFAKSSGASPTVEVNRGAW